MKHTSLYMLGKVSIRELLPQSVVYLLMNEVGALCLNVFVSKILYKLL